MCDATRFRIRIGQEEMPEVWRYLSQHVSVVIPEAGSRRLKVELPASSPEWKGWTPGTPISLSLGYADDMAQVFEGELTGIQVVQRTDGGTWVALIARDTLHRLGRTHRCRLFERLNEGTLIRRLAGGYGLRAQVEDPGETRPSLLQNNCSDLEMLQARASRRGCVYWLERKTLHVAKQRPLGPTITLRAGEHLHRLETLISASRVPASVTVLGHSLNTGAQVSGVARAQSLKPSAGGRRTGVSEVARAFPAPGWGVSEVPVLSVNDALGVAQGQLQRRARAFAVARGTCAGSPRLQPGARLTLEGLPPLSQGPWELCAVEHALDGTGGYVTHFEARRTVLADARPASA